MDREESKPGSMTREGVDEISAGETRQLLTDKEGVALIDIRSDPEICLGYIKGAIFIPAASLETRIEELVPDKEKPVIVYCSSGNRSLAAVEKLEQAGYSRALSLAGGFHAWLNAGYEIEKENGLTREELNRYSRTMLLKEVGDKGQAKLLKARVLIAGAGGLASPAALYLAAAGVGTIGIVDFDRVDLSNLNRQVMHRTEDVGRFKTESARDAILRLNPHINVIPLQARVTAENVMDIIGDFDIVLDAVDNAETKFLLNDACFFLKKPYAFGGAVHFEGQASLFNPAVQGPCLRCLFPKPPPRSLVPS